MTKEEKPQAGGIPVFCSYSKIVRTIEVIPNPRNPNKHPDSQVALLARVIKNQGWRAPITVSTLSGMIVRGHGRLAAAKRLGAEEVPVDFQDYGSEAEEWADLIADNRLAELANLDNQMLMDIISEIDTGEIDISLTGYTEEDLAQMISKMSGEEDQVPIGEDEIPEMPEESITEPGDIWQLGPHRVICGDSTDPQTIGKLMAGNQAAMIFTDPPYGVDYVSQSGKFEKIAGDAETGDDLIAKVLLPAFKLAAEHSIPEAPFYIWHASATRKEYEYAMAAAGLTERQYLIWSKQQIVLGWANYNWSHEPCFYAGKEGQKINFYGGRDQSTVWYATVAGAKDIQVQVGTGLVLLDGKGGKLFIATKPPKGKKYRHLRLTKKDQVVHLHSSNEAADLWEVARDHNPEHPTQKPVELARRAIEHSAKTGGIVLDLFLGSGSTLIGAEATSRVCYGAELDPKYCDLIKTRWEKFTGRTAERTKPEVAAPHKLSESEGKIIKGGETFTVEVDGPEEAGRKENDQDGGPPF